MKLECLNSGSSEVIKTGVHATALGLMVVMGVYNAAAWIQRRQPHLAINAVLYTVLAVWEQQHVAHHLAVINRERAGPCLPGTTHKRIKVAA